MRFGGLGNKVSQRIKREINRLYQCLLYMTALRLCPVVRKRAQTDGLRYGGLMPDEQVEGRVITEKERTALNTLTIFGHVFGSLPLKVKKIQTVSGREVFVYEFQENILEFCLKSRADEPVSPRHYRNVERSQKTGFDLLRLTLNLARGNLEQHVFCL